MIHDPRKSGHWALFWLKTNVSKYEPQAYNFPITFGVWFLSIFNPTHCDYFCFSLRTDLFTELAASRPWMCCPHRSRVISQECTGLPSHTMQTLDMHYEWNSSPFTVTHTNALLTLQRGKWAFIISINKFHENEDTIGSREIGQNMSSDFTCC